MRKKLLLSILCLILLASCSHKADEEYLIGGNWVATAGYEDGEAEGEPNCHFFEEGLEFKDEETVYNTSFAEDIYYDLSNQNKEIEITFGSSSLGFGVYKYIIHVISEDEMGFEGVSSLEGWSCYLERK